MMIFPLRDKKIWVAGHNGLVGSALVRRLQSENCDILTVPRNSLDLRSQDGVTAWLSDQKPDAVILAAAKVGGIKANQDYPADFLYDNLMIESNVIHASYKAQVEKLLFLGSSCIYPRDAAQPIKEETLLTGALEATNEAYAIAKIAGIKLCQAYRRQYGCDFVSAMPCNLYGPGDLYDLDRSHVVPALIMKFHDAKMRGAESVSLWGSGRALREFLYVDDAADALVHIMKHYSNDEPINAGSGVEISIADLAILIAEITGYAGEIVFDHAQPNGTPRKLLDSSRLNMLGWRAQTDLRTGLSLVYDDYQDRFMRDAA